MTRRRSSTGHLIASRVVERSQYRIEVPETESDALRQIARTDEERSVPLQELARIVIKCL